MRTPFRILPSLALVACTGGPNAPVREPAPPAAQPAGSATGPSSEEPARPSAEPSDPVPDLRAHPPSLPGFAVDGEPSTFDAATLFDYIDGAADGFIKFGFQELVAVDYARADSGAKGTLTVDIYRHASSNNAFGIYRQEQFSGGRQLDIGASATYKPGVLLFFKGTYYVKLSGFDLGADDETALAAAARSVAALLPGEAGMPAPVACFPEADLVPSSIRYINEAYLGHEFLHSAFVGDYEIDGRRSQMFLIEARDQAAANAVVARYAELARAKGQPVQETDGRTRLRDPYLRDAEPVTLMVRGRYVLGLFARDAAEAARRLEALAAGLRAHALLP